MVRAVADFAAIGHFSASQLHAPRYTPPYPHPAVHRPRCIRYIPAHTPAIHHARCTVKRTHAAIYHLIPPLSSPHRCTVKRTHAGHGYTRPLAWPEAKKAAKWEEGHVVKDRCEPCHLVHVLQVVVCSREWS